MIIIIIIISFHIIPSVGGEYQMYTVYIISNKTKLYTSLCSAQWHAPNSAAQMGLTL